MILAGLLLLSGWGWAAFATKGRVALWQAILGAVSCSGGWLALLALCGLSWKPWWAMLPLLLGLVLATCRVGALRHQLQSQPVQAGLVALGLGVFSQLPAWGWDFRYQWGLKAKVFAAFGGFHAAWLGNPEVAFANPQYPPLWPTLASFAMTFGASAEEAAAIWSALLRLGLASTCWGLAAAGDPWKRWVAAALGAFAPALFRPFFSGYAEPLVAFLLAATVLVTTEKQQPQPGWLWTSASLLSLGKGEGVLWLACLGAMGFPRWEGKQRLAFALSCLPAVAWLFWVHNVLPEKSLLEVRWEQLGARLFSLPEALLQAGPEAFLALLVFALVVFAGWGRTLLPGASLAFALGLGVVYLTGPHPLSWWLANSLVRVLAVPVPALLAPALAAGTTKPPLSRAQSPS